jgi:hypothetical protein
MESIKKNLEDLNGLILSGKAIEGFDKYYDDSIVMQENTGEPMVGKELNRKREVEFFSSITDFREAEVKSVGFGENTSFVVWDFDYTHKDWGVRKYTQVAVQTWKDGKIVKEQFFYGN